LLISHFQAQSNEQTNPVVIGQQVGNENGDDADAEMAAGKIFDFASVFPSLIE